MRWCGEAQEKCKETTDIELSADQMLGIKSGMEPRRPARCSTDWLKPRRSTVSDEIAVNGA